MQKNLKVTLLRAIQKGAYSLKQLAEAIDSVVPKKQSMRQALRDVDRFHERIDIALIEMRRSFESRQRLYECVSRLKRDGLIENDGHTLLLSKIGRTFLRKVGLRLPSPIYPAVQEDDLKIVIFDIPERLRKKRQWLRSVLKNLKFRLLQQSVWMGKARLPRRLLEDLERMQLLPFIEIFTVQKAGTLHPARNR